MILLAAVALTVLLGCVAWASWAQRRTPAELRSDWWPQFEREFRAYADRAGSGAEKARGRRTIRREER